MVVATVACSSLPRRGAGCEAAAERDGLQEKVILVSCLHIPDQVPFSPLLHCPLPTARQSLESPGASKKKKKKILSSLNSPELPNMNSWSCWLVAKLCPTLATPRTVAHRAPLSMGFPRQEYWSGAPFPSPGGLPDSGAEPRLLRWQADSLPLRHVGSPLERSGARSLWFRRLPR